MVPISLAAALALMYFYISTFRSMCAVPNMAVLCSSLTLWFSGMVLTYFLNDFEMVIIIIIIIIIMSLLKAGGSMFPRHVGTLNVTSQNTTTWPTA
jgi:hypothetical protein